jgi:hypothetical protein
VDDLAEFGGIDMAEMEEEILASINQYKSKHIPS